MTAISVAAALTLAATCQNVVAATTIVQMALHESRLDPAAVHTNRDGSRDLGLMQINEKNLAYLQLADPFDPCQSIAAAARLMQTFSRYNTGSPSTGIANGYADAVMRTRYEAPRTAPPAAAAPDAAADLNDEPEPQSPPGEQ